VSAGELAWNGAEKGDFDDRIAAMVTAASKHLKILPNRMSFPKKTSRGSRANWCPSGVSSSSGVKALTSTRASIARRMFLAEGGSKA
jgi:hypothetical protein